MFKNKCQGLSIAVEIFKISGSRMNRTSNGMCKVRFALTKSEDIGFTDQRD